MRPPTDDAVSDRLVEALDVVVSQAHISQLAKRIQRDEHGRRQRVARQIETLQPRQPSDRLGHLGECVVRQIEVDQLRLLQQQRMQVGEAVAAPRQHARCRRPRQHQRRHRRQLRHRRRHVPQLGAATRVDRRERREVEDSLINLDDVRAREAQMAHALQSALKLAEESVGKELLVLLGDAVPQRPNTVGALGGRRVNANGGRCQQGNRRAHHREGEHSDSDASASAAPRAFHAAAGRKIRVVHCAKPAKPTARANQLGGLEAAWQLRLQAVALCVVEDHKVCELTQRERAKHKRHRHCECLEERRRLVLQVQRVPQRPPQIQQQVERRAHLLAMAPLRHEVQHTRTDDVEGKQREDDEDDRRRRRRRAGHHTKQLRQDLHALRHEQLVLVVRARDPERHVVLVHQTLAREGEACEARAVLARAGEGVAPRPESPHAHGAGVRRVPREDARQRHEGDEQRHQRHRPRQRRIPSLMRHGSCPQRQVRREQHHQEQAEPAGTDNVVEGWRRDGRVVAFSVAVRQHRRVHINGRAWPEVMHAHGTLPLCVHGCGGHDLVSARILLALVTCVHCPRRLDH
mmetsp:Transcript_5623/g.20128  ORF Transcript_5623/g.20128 Transcript_5623/m.20128 type:complete len:576 (+) Transcript_5623:954-2681(+)